MPITEITSRLKHYVQKTLWRHRHVWNAPSATITLSDPWHFIKPPTTVNNEIEFLIDEADQYLKRQYELLNVHYEMPVPDWHWDHETGVRSPTIFTLDIDYRKYDIAGNVKNIWEHNRHRHLTVLAAAYALTGKEIYAQEIDSQLESWIKQNPFPYGINWHSSLELAIRLIAWVWIERLLRGSPCHDKFFGPNGSLWPLIYWHQWLIAMNPSSGSSANNHLVGEMAGLFISATIWPYFQQSVQWQTIARNSLEREIVFQTFPSGLNRELAFSYHRFSLELFLLSAVEAQRVNQSMSENYRLQLRNMLEVIPKISDVSGNLPRYGDEDGGTALQLKPQQSHPLDWLYHIALKHDILDTKPANLGASSLAAELIWPDSIVEESSTNQQLPVSLALEDAGLYVLTSRRGTHQEIFCLADAGPLGFLSIAAHGHADALSFTLSLGGQCIIIDPGTYKYFCDPWWRNYFRSTKAHNTVTVDGLDQSVIGGAFLWTHKAECRVLDWRTETDSSHLVAEHDGYSRLKDSVIHRRHWNLHSSHLELIDMVEGKGIHAIEWRLHFSPECSVRLEGLRCDVEWPNGKMHIELSPILNWRFVCGDSEGGWYSPRYSLKAKTQTLIGSMTLQTPVKIKNTLRFDQ